MNRIRRAAVLVGCIATLSACAARAEDPRTLPRCTDGRNAELPPRPTPDQIRAVQDSLRLLGRDAENALIFVPHDRAPEVTNRRAAAASLERHYPDALKSTGRGGKVFVWTLIDDDGSVLETEVAQSSGSIALDRAAVAALREFSFSPAVWESCRVAVWVRLPIAFAVAPA